MTTVKNIKNKFVEITAKELGNQLIESLKSQGYVINKTNGYINVDVRGIQEGYLYLHVYCTVTECKPINKD